MNITQRKYAIQRLDSIFTNKVRELYTAQLKAAEVLLEESKITKADLLQYVMSGNPTFVGQPEDLIGEDSSLGKVLDLNHIRKFLGKPEAIKVKYNGYINKCGSAWYFNSYDKYVELVKALQEAKDQLMLQDAQAAAQALEQFNNIKMSVDCTCI